MGTLATDKPRRGAPLGNQYAKGHDPGPNAGRPTKYKPEYVQIAKTMCALGAVDRDLAIAFDVNLDTINVWKSAHPEFFEALKIGKEGPDERVKRALYHLACGYSFDSVKIFANNRTGENAVVPYVEHVPPNVTAAMFWLKNRRRDEFKDKHELEHSGPDGGPMQNAVTISILPVPEGMFYDANGQLVKDEQIEAGSE